MSRAEGAGEALGKGIWRSLSVIGRTVLLFFTALTRPIPRVGEAVWRRVSYKAIHNYHKAAGGDAIALEVQPSNKWDLTPVKYRAPEAVEMDEKPGWKARKRDKVWRPSADDAQGRLGRTPVVALDSDSWRSTSTYQARVAEAVDLGETRPLYRVDEAQLSAELDYSQGTGAVADGGQTQADIRFNPRTSPVFEDVIIDLGSDEYDGQAVSWTKTKELMHERTTTEEMANQEERGFLAGRSRKDIMSLMWKLFLVASLVAIAGLIGKELVAAMFGSGGGDGGGGGMVPLTLSNLGVF